MRGNKSIRKLEPINIDEIRKYAKDLLSGKMKPIRTMTEAVNNVKVSKDDPLVKKFLYNKNKF
jgi:hypothetical protein